MASGASPHAGKHYSANLPGGHAGKVTAWGSGRRSVVAWWRRPVAVSEVRLAGLRSGPLESGPRRDILVQGDGVPRIFKYGFGAGDELTTLVAEVGVMVHALSRVWRVDPQRVPWSTRGKRPRLFAGCG